MSSNNNKNITNHKIDNNYFIQVMDTVKKLSEKQSALNTAVRSSIECKICKSVPKRCYVMTTCCNQLFGCASCYNLSIKTTRNCPVCRSEGVDVVDIKGLDNIVDELGEGCGLVPFRRLNQSIN